jgi:SAM-dependent methyltransferase
MTWLVPRHLPTYLELDTLFTSLQDAGRQTRGGWLLDIGCGNKPYLPFFQHVTRYVGIDLPPPPGVERCPDVWASALRLPFAAERFDTVLCTQVLEHVPQPEQLLREVFRVMRVGGRLILTAPQTWGLHEEPEDYYRFTRYGLQYLLVKAGFQVESLEARGGLFRLIGQMLLNYYYVRNRIPRLTPWLKRLNTTVNTFFAYLDRRWPWDKDTLGYVAQAIRPQNSMTRNG